MSQPNLPATIADEYGTGLEDIENETGMVPRIGINHPGGTFKDSLSGEEFPKIYGVALGMIKQRVMWEQGDIESGAKPQCKSQDATTGYPNVSGKPGESFPWKDAPGLDPNVQPKDEHGRITITCETCPFAQWGPRNEKGKSVPPLCKERHTYPVVYNREMPVPGYYPPYLESGIVSFQGSGIKPSKQYLASFVRNKRPLYSAVLEIGLDVNKRGTVEYSVPSFKKLAEVPQDDWEIYARDYLPIREFLREAPRANDDGSDPAKGSGQTSSQAAVNAGISQASVTVGQPIQATVTTPTATVLNTPTTSAPVEDAAPVDDDLPF